MNWALAEGNKTSSVLHSDLKKVYQRIQG